jgi:hypothetical protein
MPRKPRTLGAAGVALIGIIHVRNEICQINRGKKEVALERCASRILT